MSFLTDIFVPLFIVMNAIPVLPLYLGITVELDPAQRNRLSDRALLVGMIVAVVMTVGGGGLLRALGITLHDLRIAGGLILLVFAVHDLLFSRQRRKQQAAQELGVVPLGVPLIVGPATMTALIVLAEAFGIPLVLLGAGANVAVNWLILRFAPQLMRIAGAGGIRVFAKVMGLFLAAIATSMIRLGITGVIRSL